MSTKLYNLCKELYKKTDWVDWSELTHMFTEEDDYKEIHEYVNTSWNTIPVYTSDYILSKLPPKIIHDHADSESDFWLVISPGTKGWYVCYALNGTEFHTRHGVRGETPLEALLREALALVDDGEIELS